MSVEWENPPTVQRGVHTGGKWIPVLTELLERPGQWARIAEYDNPKSAYSTTQNLNARKVKMPTADFEFVSRVVDGRGYVYGRALNGTEPS